MKLKELVQRFKTWLNSFWSKVNEKVLEVTPVAIKITEKVGTFVDGPVDDFLLGIIKAAIPGQVDDVIIDKYLAVVKDLIPKVLIQLHMVQDLAGVTDKDEQIKIILSKFKFTDDEMKNKTYHDFCFLIIDRFADGKWDWSDSVIASEYYFKYIYNKNGTVAA